MSEAFVLDASIAFSWVLPTQASSEADVLLTRIESGVTPVVPTLWYLEVANGLLAAQRRRLLSGVERRAALTQLAGLSLVAEEMEGRAAFERVSSLAERSRLSVYDAVYLDLALRRRLPLASRDRKLMAAAKRSGLPALDAR